MEAPCTRRAASDPSGSITLSRAAIVPLGVKNGAQQPLAMRAFLASLRGGGAGRWLRTGRASASHEETSIPKHVSTRVASTKDRAPWRDRGCRPEPPADGCEIDPALRSDARRRWYRTEHNLSALRLREPGRHACTGLKESPAGHAAASSSERARPHKYRESGRRPDNATD